MDVEGTSNGEGAECGEETPCLQSEPVNNVFGFEFMNHSSDGSSGGSENFQMCKRRRQLMSSSNIKLQGDGGPYKDQTVKLPFDILMDANYFEQRPLPGTDHGVVNGSNDHLQRQWRNVVLEHMYQLFSGDEGGLQHCIRDALLCHPESGFNMEVKEYSASHEDNRKYSAQAGNFPNGTKDADEKLEDVMSNGSLKESNPQPQNTTEMCQRVFFDVIISEKFTSLCKLLFDNFQDIKVDSLFHLSLLNSRMKNGVYEHSPVVFSSDIQRVWRRLQEIGSEIVSLARSLSNISRTSFSEQVGCSHGDVEEEKQEFCAWEPESHVKLEPNEVCGVYKVCTCRRCGEKADGKDCIACDSCEEMFHVSCTKPPVKEIPPKSWYCSSCVASGIGSLHENCVICERLNAPRTVNDNVADKNHYGNYEAFTELEENSNCSVADGLQLSPGSENPCVCKICGSNIKKGEKLRSCEHPYCPQIYYHVRCLTNKQLKSYCSRWYCPSCLCRACLIDKDDDKIVLCDGCDAAYHIYCMKPRRISIPRGKWFCRKCDAGIQRIRRAKKAYERMKSEMNLNQKDREESDKSRGGVDMLLTAANALLFEENLADIQTKS